MISGIASVSYGSGALLWNLFQYYYINPTNINIDDDFGLTQQSDIMKTIPNFFATYGLLSIGIQVFGILCLRERIVNKSNPNNITRQYQPKVNNDNNKVPNAEDINDVNDRSFSYVHINHEYSQTNKIPNESDSEMSINEDKRMQNMFMYSKSVADDMEHSLVKNNNLNQSAKQKLITIIDKFGKNRKISNNNTKSKDDNRTYTRTSVTETEQNGTQIKENQMNLYNIQDINIDIILGSWVFWRIFLISLLNVSVYLFIIGNYAQIYIQYFGVYNNFYISIVGGIASLFNGFGRIFWATMIMDNKSFRESMATMCGIMTLFTVTLTMCGLGSDLIKKILLVVWFCVLFGCVGGNYSLLPTIVYSTFGNKHSSTLMTMIFLSEIPAALIYGVLTTSSQNMPGAPFLAGLMTMTIFGLASFVLTMKYDNTYGRDQFLLRKRKKKHKHNPTNTTNNKDTKPNLSPIHPKKSLLKTNQNKYEATHTREGLFFANIYYVSIFLY